MSTLDPIKAGQSSELGGSPFIDAPGATGTDSPAPELESITPASGEPYSALPGVSLTGLRMAGGNPVLTVPDGWAYANLVIAANGLSATLDLYVGPSSGDLILTTGDGQSNPLGFGITPPPAAVTVATGRKRLLLLGAG